jgi:hypothetical protein
MAGSLADYAENAILEHSVGKTTFALPTVSCALFTVAPTDTGGGTECTGGSYARKATAGLWGTASGGAISNSSAITFTTATASWGTVVAFALLDGSSNYIWWGDVTPNKLIDNGDTASFAVGDLDLTLA